MHHFNYHDSKHNKIENEIILLKTFARENAICGEGGKEEKSLVISE
jgi:hypothetical protein